LSEESELESPLGDPWGRARVACVRKSAKATAAEYIIVMMDVERADCCTNHWVGTDGIPKTKTGAILYAEKYRGCRGAKLKHRMASSENVSMFKHVMNRRRSVMQRPVGGGVLCWSHEVNNVEMPPPPHRCIFPPKSRRRRREESKNAFLPSFRCSRRSRTWTRDPHVHHVQQLRDHVSSCPPVSCV
jgi:hypothetical protein